MFSGCESADREKMLKGLEEIEKLNECEASILELEGGLGNWKIEYQQAMETQWGINGSDGRN